MEPPSKRSRRTTSVAISSTRLFNTDSPIAKQETELQTFLSLCILNWPEYSEEEKQDIIMTLPRNYRTLAYDAEGCLVCPLDPAVVASDPILRDQVARFKRDVADGFYTKTWQEKAKKAMEERANGKFDEHLARHAEDSFVEAENEGDHVGSDTASSDEEYRAGNKSKRKARRGEKRGKKNNSTASSSLPNLLDAEEDDEHHPTCKS